jgi:putative oxidoreductase
MRVTVCALLFWTNGLPKIAHYAEEKALIADPFRLGRKLTLWLAISAEVICPVAIALGLFTRLACLPIIALLCIAMLVVHRDWGLERGQFGWLYLIVFSSLLIMGPGRYSLDFWL